MDPNLFSHPGCIVRTSRPEFPSPPQVSELQTLVVSCSRMNSIANQPTSWMHGRVDTFSAVSVKLVPTPRRTSDPPSADADRRSSAPVQPVMAAGGDPDEDGTAAFPADDEPDAGSAALDCASGRNPLAGSPHGRTITTIQPPRPTSAGRCGAQPRRPGSTRNGGPRGSYASASCRSPRRSGSRWNRSRILSGTPERS